LHIDSGNINQSKLIQIDNQLDLLDNILNEKFKDLDKSYIYLKEKLNKISTCYDKEKALRDSKKNTNSEEITTFERNINNLLAEEKNV
jgi:hypothetical protein